MRTKPSEKQALLLHFMDEENEAPSHDFIQLLSGHTDKQLRSFSGQKHIAASEHGCSLFHLFWPPQDHLDRVCGSAPWGWGCSRHRIRWPPRNVWVLLPGSAMITCGAGLWSQEYKQQGEGGHSLLPQPCQLCAPGAGLGVTPGMSQT